jgi:hypothetical protein
MRGDIAEVSSADQSSADVRCRLLENSSKRTTSPTNCARRRGQLRVSRPPR